MPLWSCPLFPTPRVRWEQQCQLGPCFSWATIGGHCFNSEILENIQIKGRAHLKAPEAPLRCPNWTSLSRLAFPSPMWLSTLQRALWRQELGSNPRVWIWEVGRWAGRALMDLLWGSVVHFAHHSKSDPSVLTRLKSGIAYSNLEILMNVRFCITYIKPYFIWSQVFRLLGIQNQLKVFLH